MTAKQLLGGVGGGLLGGAIWVAIVALFGREASYVACAVGVLIGLGVLAAGVRGYDDSRGLRAAMLALVMLLGARMAIAWLDARDEAARLLKVTDETLLCAVADQVLGELRAAGQQPPVAGADSAHSRADYADEVWAEATRRWSALTDAQRRDRRAQAIERRRHAAEAQFATAFVEGLGGLDALWIAIGAAAAFKLASGTGPSDQMRGGLDLEPEPARLTESNLPSAGPAPDAGPSMLPQPRRASRDRAA
ncbi:MAG: hypothetical protein ACF8R7_08095 [Phycisphaerales bacterium JB039]